MKRNDTTFKEMVSRIQSGELTRIQAADTYGIKPTTLNVWLMRSKLTETTRAQATHLRGAALGWSITDPEKLQALEEAVQKVLAGELSGTEAIERYPNIAHATLARRVRLARLAAGQPVQKRRTRAEMAQARVTAQPM